jgi:hypothetical protein
VAGPVGAARAVAKADIELDVLGHTELCFTLAFKAQSTSIA